MNELVKILPGENKYLNVTWQVNNFCNYKCSYCNEGNWSGTHKNDDTEKYIRFLDKLITRFQFKGYKSFKFFFSGGEPVYWKPLIEIAEFLHVKCDKPLLAINTNLSNPLSWWVRNYHLFQDVVASYHIEFADKEKFVTNAKFLQDKMNYLAIRKTDGYQRKWGNVTERRESRPAYSAEVWSDGTTKPVNSNRLAAERLNNFEGWHCWLNDAIFINPHGDISAGSCGVSGRIGNINEDVINFLDRPVICPKMHCTCGTDIIIPKISHKVYDGETDYPVLDKKDINES
jgi:organic radical activating enzyme